MSVNYLGVPDRTGMLPRIAVLGVGGGGCKAIHRMMQSGLGGVEFVAANTDTQDLAAVRADCSLQLGAGLTRGFGAGTDPEVGRRAAEESIADIRAALSGVSLVFLAAGMGGGTGTGALPVIGRVARELGILTVGVITKPFEYEGGQRMEAAMGGIERAESSVDSLLVIANQKLIPEGQQPPPLLAAFRQVDEVLLDSIRGVVDLVVRPGLVNMDFADLCMALRESGMGVIGSGEAEGPERGRRAAQEAASNPLLDGIDLQGAKTLLINVTGGDDLDLRDMDSAAEYLTGRASSKVRMKVGAAHDPEMGGRVRVYVAAGGVRVPTSQAASQTVDIMRARLAGRRGYNGATATNQHRNPSWGNAGILSRATPVPARPAPAASANAAPGRGKSEDDLWGGDFKIDAGSIGPAVNGRVSPQAPARAPASNGATPPRPQPSRQSVTGAARTPQAASSADRTPLRIGPGGPVGERRAGGPARATFNANGDLAPGHPVVDAPGDSPDDAGPRMREVSRIGRGLIKRMLAAG